MLAGTDFVQIWVWIIQKNKV